MSGTQKTFFATRLFIDGIQRGSNSSYMDAHTSLEAAIEDTKAWIAEEGWVNATIETADLPRWESMADELVPTIIVRANRA